MDDFSTLGMPNGFGLYPPAYNYPEPFKRPLSSTCSTVIENALNNSFYAALGGSGGAKIFPAIIQVFVNIVDGWADDVSGAVEMPRVHNQLYSLQVKVDETTERGLVEGLRRRRHNVTREYLFL